MNVLLAPDSVPPVRVTVMVWFAPAWVTVTLCVRVPLVNAPEVVGLIVPAVVVKPTVLAKLVTVLLFKSCAVMVILKAVPAVCGLLMFPMAK